MAGDYRQRPLEAAGHARKRALAALRRPIERTFGVLKRWSGYGRVRYRSLVRNAPSCSCSPSPSTCAAPRC